MRWISVWRVANVIVTTMAMTLVFTTLGWTMMPQWNTRLYIRHIVIASADATITYVHTNISHEGRYRMREARLSIKTDDGVTLSVVLHEPVDIPGPCSTRLFIHGLGINGAEGFGGTANIMASVGIITLAPAKRDDNYAVLHHNRPCFAREYGHSLNMLRGRIGVDPVKTGIYTESEGTWIATILTSKRQDIAFVVSISASVSNGRGQMAMVASACACKAGASKPVVKDMARLISLGYTPFDLAYVGLNADRYLRSLTIPVLVNCGTYDTTMPTEQGAQRIIATASGFDSEDIAVHYLASDHQMWAGEGLLTSNLPLVEGYTQALEGWANSVTTGTKANGWATPRVAGTTPHQRSAASRRAGSGIVGSLSVLVGLMVAGPMLAAMVAILNIGLTVFSWLQTLLTGRRSVATVRAVHATSNKLRAAQRRILHSIAGLFADIGTTVMVITELLHGYVGAIGISAVLVMPQPRLFAVRRAVLQIATMLLVVLPAQETERVWYCRADIIGVWCIVCMVVTLGNPAILMTLAFWGLFLL